MGKTGSKHVHRPCDSTSREECFLVNAHLNKAWEEQIWKKTTKTGYNLANYNMNQSMSELSICLEDKQDNTEVKENNKDNNIPLKVELPPIKSDNGTGKVFTFDQGGDGTKVFMVDHNVDNEKGEKEGETRLNIEEFECGVHFGGGENSKQEWSFTLYDFDGHGKITKEDLVGLLKALYDAIGSSIKIPNNGTKTLKLRLSVGQEAAVQDTGQAVVASARTVNKTEKDTNECDTRNTPKKKDNSKHKENIKKDSPKSKVKDISRLNNLVGSSQPAQSMPAKCNNKDTQQAQAAQTAAAKSRLSTQKHKELASLVQENMERNHIKALRRHHSDCRGCVKEQKPHKRRHRASRTTNSAKDNNMKQQHTRVKSVSAEVKKAAETDDTPKESQDRRNYYLDLAGVENTTSKFQDSPSTALTSRQTSEMKSLHLNTSKFQSVKPFSALSAGHFCAPRHVRSRSHEVPENKCDNSQVDTENCQLLADKSKLEHFRSRSFDPQDSSVSNIRAMKGNPQLPTTSTSGTQKQSKFRPVSLPAHIPETESPHYHRRHRHREKDHDMAMQQVAEWIEREHTVDFNGEKIVVQRHEHHHVHEHHHHHHYHHYYEA